VPTNYRVPRKSESPRPEPSEERSLAEKHLGLIAQRVLHYWWMLPARVRAWYDADDMVAEVVLHVFRVSSRHDSARAKESTWVWWVATNKCKSILSHHQTLQYAACVEEELTEETAENFSSFEDVDRQRLFAACNAVERTIEAGPVGVRELLDRILNKHDAADLAPYAHVVAALRKAAADAGATLADFELVYRYAS
jgi:DNA-directed RNA polymerase specialized sigma24 family protein